MEDVSGLFRWCAEKTGVKLLEVCHSLEEGYENVVVKADDRIYGISSELDWRHLRSMESASIARDHGYLSEDFPDFYFERARRIGLDMQQRSRREGFEFYNGKLAKLKGIKVRNGDSPYRQILELHIEYTTYFTALGTNINFSGYQYTHMNIPPEPHLPQELKWPLASDWRNVLAQSPLANQFALHLFLYNEWEIIYVRRGRVGEGSGLWNTPINGVMEFKIDNPDTVDGIPNIGMAARREALYELNIEINPQEIHWLGCFATMSSCEPGIVGVYKITDRREQITQRAITGKEQREVAELAQTSIRQKEIRAIPILTQSHPIEVNIFGLLNIPLRIPNPLTRHRSLKQLVREKILLRQERNWFRKAETWSDGGATALLLCLAHLSNKETFFQALRELKQEFS